METLLKLYAFIRSLTNPFVWRLFYWRGRHATDESVCKYTEFLGADMDEASRILNSTEYKDDRLKGFLDTSVPTKYAYSFFDELKHGRDCDDWARLWSVWGWLNGYEAREWIIADPWLKKAHIFTTLSKDKKHWLMNYHPYGPYQSLDTALRAMELWYDHPVIVEYKWRREW